MRKFLLKEILGHKDNITIDANFLNLTEIQIS